MSTRVKPHIDKLQFVAMMSENNRINSHYIYKDGCSYYIIKTKEERLNEL